MDGVVGRMRWLAVVVLGTAWLGGQTSAQDPPPRRFTSHSFDRPVETQTALLDLVRSASTPDGLAPLNWVKRRLSYWDSSALRQVLTEIHTDRTTDPFVRVRVSQVLSQLYRATGDVVSAHKVLADFGLWNDWMLRGFVVDSGLSCQETPLEPADAVELSGLTCDGLLDLGALLWPPKEGAAFVSIWMRTDVAVDTVLRLGADGPITVWVNGRVVAEADGMVEAGLDQISVPLRVGPGAFEVRVRACADGSRPFRIVGRATDRAGRPEPRLQVSARRPLGSDLSKIKVLTAGRYADPIGYWVRKSSQAQSPDSRVRFALAMRELGQPIPNEWLGASAQERWELAQSASDRHVRAQHLYEALNSDPKDLRSLVALAQLAVERQRYLEARELLDQAFAVDPMDLEAQLLAARHAVENQAIGESIRLLRQALDRFPDVPAVILALATTYFQRGDLRTAGALFDQLQHRSVDPFAVPSWQREIAAASGNATAAAEWSRRMTRLRPDLFGNALIAANSAVDAGLVNEAKEFLNGLHPLAQRNPEILKEAAAVWMRLGDAQQAVEWARASLRIRPQDADLQRLLMRLSPEETAFEDAFRRDVARVIADSSKSTRIDGMEYLADHKVVRVYENGLSSSYFQRIIRLSGVDGTGQTLVIPYDPYRQQVVVQRFDVQKPDGRTIALTERNERVIGEEWYGMYFDLRHIEIPLDRLVDGDVFVAEYRIDDIGQNLFGDTFGDLTYLQDVVPKHEASVTYVTPLARKVHFAFVDPLGRVAHSKTEKMERDIAIRSYTVRDVPALNQEPGAPGLSELCPYVHASTFESYEDVARYYLSLLRTQAVSNNAIRRHVEEMTSHLTSEKDKIAVLFNDLTRTFRYVGLEFGVHGYKPYSCPVVFGRKFGDCKDQSTLLVVMLKELGIEAHVALIRTRSQGKVALQPASLSVFNHAVVFVPALGWWLDPTAMFNGIDELPAEDQGAVALVVDDKKPRIVTTPQYPADANRSERWVELRLTQDGGATVSGTMTARGLFAPRLRQALESAGLRETTLEEMIAGSFPGFVLTSAEFVGLDDVVTSPKIAFTGSVPRLFHAEGERFDIFGGTQTHFVDRLAAASTRTHDLLLDFPFVERSVLRIVPPSGWIPVPPGPGTTIEEDFARHYSVDRLEKDVWVRTAELHVPAWHIPANRYGVWRGFLKLAETRSNATVVFRKQTTAGPDDVSLRDPDNHLRSAAKRR